MKLRISQEKGLSFLAVFGPITKADGEILRAGLTKLLLNGQNRIVVEWDAQATVNGEIYRILVGITALARELSGDLVFQLTSEAEKKRVDFITKPPMIASFFDRQQVLAHFFPPVGGAKVAAGVVPGSAQEGEAIVKLKAEIGELKEKLKAAEQGALMVLKRDLESEKKANADLKASLLAQWDLEKTPAGPRGIDEKIKSLESQLEEAYKKIAAG